MKTAFFSILAPGKHLPAHRGPYKGVMRYHLGLLIPEPRRSAGSASTPRRATGRRASR
jgi:aspartyl/asparaginyl beta-hydroxylase (cupin superfamily)